MHYFGSALRVGAIASFSLLLLDGATPAGAAMYLLSSDSQLSEGCFELCACPQWDAGVVGSFELVPAGFDGAFEIFNVPAVDWTVESPPTEVSGSGTYRIDRVARLQRLELDLRRDLGDIGHFDSGLVVTDVDFPAIHVEIAIHGAPACFDTRFELHAFPPVAVQDANWSAIRVMYKR